MNRITSLFSFAAVMLVILRFMQPGDYSYTGMVQNVMEPVASGTITVC